MDEGDTWDDWDGTGDPQTSTVPAFTVMGALVYKSLLDSYGPPKPQHAFEPGYVWRSKAPYNAAVGLAEIGVTQQLQQGARTQRPTSEEPSVGKSYAQYWEYGETFTWVIGTAAAIALAGIIGGGPKGRPWGSLGKSGVSAGYGPGGQFNMAQKFPWMYASNPLRSVTNKVYGQLLLGASPQGSDVVVEKRTQTESVGDFGVGSAFAHGITGHI